MKTLLALILAVSAHAQVSMLIASQAASGSSYTGVGNIQTTGVITYYSSRAYNGANAGLKSIVLCDSGDAHCADALTDATTGAVVPPASNPNCTAGHACTVKEYYDPTGNGFDMIQTSEANRFVFDPTTGCATGTSASQGYVSASTKSQSQPYSMGTVSSRTGGGATYQGVLYNLSGTGAWIGYPNIADTAIISTSAVGLNAAATDNALHSLQGMYNGASSKIAIDGSSTTGGAGTDALSSTFNLSGAALGTVFVGTFCEGYVFAGDISANFAAISTNQRAFWGF
jgi:hypothetical protein